MQWLYSVRFMAKGRTCSMQVKDKPTSNSYSHMTSYTEVGKKNLGLNRVRRSILGILRFRKGFIYTLMVRKPYENINCHLERTHAMCFPMGIFSINYLILFCCCFFFYDGCFPLKQKQPKTKTHSQLCHLVAK